MGQRLADALGALEREVLSAPEAPKATFTKTVERDAEHRTVSVLVECSDGRRWRKTPVYDAEHRVERVTVEELAPSPSS